MSNSFFAIPAALLWGSVAWRWPSRREGRTQQALWLALVALAATATLQIPTLEHAVHAAMPTEPNLIYALKHVLIVGVAAAAHEILRSVTLPADEARRLSRQRGIVAAAVAATLVVLFVRAPVDDAALTSQFADRYGREPAMLAFWAVFLTWLALALVSTVRLAWRYGRHAPRNPVSTAILLIGGSAAACFGYVVVKSIYLVAVNVSGGQRLAGPYATGTTGLLIVAMALMAIGCAWPTLGRLPGIRQLATLRRLRRLRPLWLALYEATPAIALTSPSPMTRVGIFRDLDVRLYRRVIEIRDGLLALRPYAPPDLHDRARDLAIEFGVGAQQLESVVEAAWVEVATRAKLRGDTAAGHHVTAVEGGFDAVSEAAILEQISRALSSSPTVAAIADRLETTEPAEGSV